MIIFVVTADYVTGVKMSFSLFYFLPVAFISWRRGLKFGIAFSLLCILARYFTDDLGGKVYPSILVLYWNTFVRGGTLLFTGYVISRLHTTIQEAEKAKNNAITASRSKTEFLWGMSHEIRTPLNSILAMAEVLGDTPLREDQAGYVKIFKSEGRNLLLLINDLLDNAKVDEGRFTAESLFPPYAIPMIRRVDFSSRLWTLESEYQRNNLANSSFLSPRLMSRPAATMAGRGWD